MSAECQRSIVQPLMNGGRDDAFDDAGDDAVRSRSEPMMVSPLAPGGYSVVTGGPPQPFPRVQKVLGSPSKVHPDMVADF